MMNQAVLSQILDRFNLPEEVPGQDPKNAGPFPWGNTLSGPPEQPILAEPVAILVTSARRGYGSFSDLLLTQDFLRGPVSQPTVDATIKREYVLRNQPAIERFL